MPTPQRPSAAPHRRPVKLSRWTMTLVTAVGAVVIRALLQPVLGDTMPFLLAYPAMVLAASMWGIASGLVVALACAFVAAVPFVPPTLAASDRPMHLGAFGLVAIFICLVCNLRARSSTAPGFDDPETGVTTPLATWLRAMVWGALFVPLTAFVAAAWWGYEHAVGEAKASAERTAVLVRGQAQRTFEIARDIAHRANDAAAGNDAAVQRREAEIHARLADMVAGLPSVVNLNVWDAQGHPLARSDRYPTDHVVSVADRALSGSARMSSSGMRTSKSSITSARCSGPRMPCTVARTMVSPARVMRASPTSPIRPALRRKSMSSSVRTVST